MALVSHPTCPVTGQLVTRLIAPCSCTKYFHMALSHESQHDCCNVCIYCSPFVLILPVHTTKKEEYREVFPQSLDLASHLSLITLCPPLQLYSCLASLHTFAMPHTLVLPHTLVSPCTLVLPHTLILLCTLTLLCTLVLLCTLASLCLTLFPCVTSPPSPTISISHRLLATAPGDYPLPLNCTLRASLGLCFDWALLLAPSDLSCALGTSPLRLSAGRTEYFCPWKKLVLCTHACPCGAHPFFQIFVWSSISALSMKTSCWGSYWAILICHVDLRSSSHSIASLATPLCLWSNQLSVLDIIDINTLMSWNIQSFSWISSR